MGFFPPTEGMQPLTQHYWLPSALSLFCYRRGREPLPQALARLGAPRARPYHRTDRPEKGGTEGRMSH